MNKQFLKGLIVGLTIGIVVTALSFYLLFNRYQIVAGAPTRNTNGTVKIDKLTGETWVLSARDEKWTKIH